MNASTNPPNPRASINQSVSRCSYRRRFAFSRSMSLYSIYVLTSHLFTHGNDVPDSRTCTVYRVLREYVAGLRKMRAALSREQICRFIKYLSFTSTSCTTYNNIKMHVYFFYLHIHTVCIFAR